MKLLKELQKDLNKDTRSKIVRYIGDDQTRFTQLVTAFLNEPYRITQRAAWPLSFCVEKHPALIKPHLKTLILNMKKPGVGDAVKRNTLRFLQVIDIPKPLHATTIDICFKQLLDKKEPIAIKVFSMTVLSNLVKNYPELKNELAVAIEDQMPYGSPGFVSRGRKVLKDLKKI